MDQSILTSTKKVLGLDVSYTAFDEDIMMHINSAFGTLNQLGVGLVAGYSIEDDTANWTDYIADGPMLSVIKTYVYLRVRMLFDPPTTSYLLAAMQTQLDELTWRISTMREDADWVPGVENGNNS